MGGCEGLKAGVTLIFEDKTQPPTDAPRRTAVARLACDHDEERARARGVSIYHRIAAAPAAGARHTATAIAMTPAEVAAAAGLPAPPPPRAASVNLFKGAGYPIARDQKLVSVWGGWDWLPAAPNEDKALRANIQEPCQTAAGEQR